MKRIAPIVRRRVPFFAKHWVALAVPWLIITIFSFVSLSEYSRPVSTETYRVVLVFVGCYLFGSWLGGAHQKSQVAVPILYKVKVANLVSFHVVLSIANVFIAGYIPLVAAMRTGNSGYLSFGLTGVYGFYLAYSNFLGLLAFYNFLVTGKIKYLVVIVWIIFVLIMFVTRQNVISLLVEMFVLYVLLKGGVSTKRLVFYVIIVLVGFSIIGAVRTPEGIKEIAKIEARWNWLPDFVVWPYSYSYFNLLNLDNLVRYIGPSYDGGAFLSLAPNFVKAMLSIESSRESALEVSNFNVSSAIADLYGDSGYLSIVVVATIAGIAGQRIFHGWLRRFDVRALFVYSVLYFCALFSFFVNFWFYLPIIFQVVFVYGLLGKKGGRITSSTVSREWIKGSLLATSRENTASPGAGAG